MKPIENYEEYFVDESGNIYSKIKYGRWQEEIRIIAPQKDKNGYLRIRLQDKSGNRNRFAIHRLVAQAFLPKPEGCMMVRHLDDIKTNNHISNLAWGNARDNAADMIRNGMSMKGKKIKRSHNGEQNPNSKLTHEHVLEIRQRWDSRVTLSSLAIEYGVSYVTIGKIVKGKLWSRLVREANKVLIS